MRLAESVRNAKPISQCTDAELKKVRDIAKQHAKRKGRRHLADDFASFLLEDLARQGTLRYNLHWRWAHFLRTEVANLRCKKGRAKGLAVTKPVPIEKAIHIRAEEPLADEKLHWKDMLKSMDRDLRLVAVLTFKWGFTLEEISEVMGCTRQNVQQLGEKLEVMGARAWFRRKMTGDELVCSKK